MWLLVGALAVSGCAAGASSLPHGVRSIEELRAEVVRIESILTSSFGTVEDGVLIGNAQGTVVAACMQARGWDWRFAPESVDLAATGRSVFWTEAELFLFDDERAAATEGYGLAAYLVSQERYLAELEVQAIELQGYTPDPDTMSSQDAARFELDVFGAEADRVEIVRRDGAQVSLPGSGCLAEGTIAVFGDVETYLIMTGVRQGAEDELWGRVSESRSVRSALASWRDCMEKAGYGGGSQAPVAEPRDALLLAIAAPDDEVAIATADAACKRESSLSRNFMVAFYDVGILGEFEGDLEAYREFHTSAAERARTILGLSGS